MVIMEFCHTPEPLEDVGYRRNNDGSNRDFSVRDIVGRNGESISILEEFIPETGEIVHVFWKVVR